MKDKTVHCITHKLLCENRTESEESGCRLYNCENLHRCDHKILVIDEEPLDDEG
jgi:hypothetical protein